MRISLSPSLSFCRSLGTRLSNLSILWLSRCQVSDLSGLPALHNIKELYAPFNDIRDVTPLGQCELLEVLDLEGNRIGAVSETNENIGGEVCLHISDNEEDDDVINLDRKDRNRAAGKKSGSVKRSISRRQRMLRKYTTKLREYINLSGLSFLNFCSNLVTLNLSNNPISNITGSNADRYSNVDIVTEKKIYRRAILDFATNLSVLDDEDVVADDRMEDSTEGVNGNAFDIFSQFKIDQANREDGLEELLSIRKELALVSDAIKYAQVGMDDVQSMGGTSCSTFATSKSTSSPYSIMQRPASAMASPSSSFQRKRPSTAYSRRPSTAAPSSSAHTTDSISGLYWRKNQIKSSVLDFSISTISSKNITRKESNDDSHLTRGADAEAICGNPVRGLRARKVASSPESVIDGNAIINKFSGTHEKSKELNILEELRQWKLETAEKIDSYSDTEDGSPVKMLFSQGDFRVTNVTDYVGGNTQHEVNVLKISDSMDADYASDDSNDESIECTELTKVPLADISCNNGISNANRPAEEQNHKNLPVGRLRRKFSKQNGFIQSDVFKEGDRVVGDKAMFTNSQEVILS